MRFFKITLFACFLLLHIDEATTMSLTTTTTPQTTATTECPHARVTCPVEGCVIKSREGSDGCPKYYCDDCQGLSSPTPSIATSTESTSTFETPSTTSTTPEIVYDCFPPCIRSAVTGDDGHLKHFCNCTTTSTSPPIRTTTLITCTISAIMCSPECEPISEIGSDGCPVFHCACSSTTETSTQASTPTSPSTRVTTQCPQVAIDCRYRDCLIRSTIAADGCKSSYCDCRDVTTATITETRPTTTESTSIFETPSTATTTHGDCFPPCIETEAIGDDGHLRYTCDCTTTPATTRIRTTRSCFDWSTNCDMYPCELVSTNRHDSYGCLIYECVCPTTTVECPESATTCYPECFLRTTIAPNGCQVGKCFCPTETTPTTTTTAIPCHHEPMPCDDGGTCERVVYVGLSPVGCLKYECICSGTTDTTTTLDITTTPSVRCLESAIRCSPECEPVSRTGLDGCPVYDCFCSTTTTQTTTPITTTATTYPCPQMEEPRCDDEGRIPCESIVYEGLDNFGCPMYKCICPNTIGTSTPHITTTRLICHHSAIRCSPQCERSSRTGPDGCLVYDCRCPPTKSTPMLTSSPCPEVADDCGMLNSCSSVPAYNRDGCLYYRCICTTETTETTPSPCPEPMCLEGCRYVPRTEDNCPWCDCSDLTTETTLKTPLACTRLLCPEGCRYFTATEDRCPWCDCSDLTTPTEPTSTTSPPQCPEVLCPQGCRYITLPNGCPGCNCTTQTPTPSTATITTTITTPDHCEYPCEKVKGCHSCQCPKTCKDIVCKRFEECELREVFCKKAPCFPVPTCVKRCDSRLGKPATGNCGGILTQRWTYDSTVNACKEFPYYGCTPSPNTFKTKKQCVKACRSKAPVCQPCGPKCYTLRRPGGCPKCICPNPCEKFECPKKKTCKVREMNCFRKPCQPPSPYCA